MKSKILLGGGLFASVGVAAMLSAQAPGDVSAPERDPAPLTLNGEQPVPPDSKDTALRAFKDTLPEDQLSTDEVARRSLITSLSLPVNGAANYYNRGTNTAFREACEAGTGSERSVTCKLDVLSMTAQLRHIVETTYTLDPASNITMTSEKRDPQLWSQDSSKLYDQIKAAATTRTWAAGSPLARQSDQGVVQNALYEVSSYKRGAVTLCSSVPVSPKRGIDVCTAFDQMHFEVTSAAMPVLTNAGTLNQILLQPQAAHRDFNNYDGEYVDKYRAQQQPGGPAYVIRPD